MKEGRRQSAASSAFQLQLAMDPCEIEISPSSLPYSMLIYALWHTLDVRCNAMKRDTENTVLHCDHAEATGREGSFPQNPVPHSAAQ